MKLNELSPVKGSKKSRKRVGRGESSGLGKTCGKGSNGQATRSGTYIQVGFEGGQKPLYKRVAKRGFSNARFKVEYAVINLATLEQYFENGATINAEALKSSGLVKDQKDGIKILGVGELTKKFTITASKVSEAAKAKIEAAGGKVEVI